MVHDRKTVLVVGDALALVGAYCLMAIIRFDVGAQGALLWLQIKLFTLLFLIWIIVFFIFNLYDLRYVNPNPRNIGLLVAAMAVNSAVAALLFYLSPQSGISPKTNLIILGISAFLLLVLWRRLFYFLFARTFIQSIGIIGESPLIDDLKNDLANHPHIGRVALHESHASALNGESITLLIAEAIPPQELLALSREMGTLALSLSEAYETLFGKVPLALMTDEKALGVVTKKQNTVLAVIYRIVEIAIASAILIVVSPFLLTAMIATLIEDGSPVIYKQKRVGKHGKLFFVYKLRTMAKDAETDGAQWAQKQDRRVTRVGRVVRKTHLDEVPQMWNIIRGDLALVGPRPERPEFVEPLEREIPYYFLRHTVRPGFTGWAQIKFRYARTVLDSREKFEYDLYWLLRRNVLLDLGIFAKTIQIIFTH